MEWYNFDNELNTIQQALLEKEGADIAEGYKNDATNRAVILDQPIALDEEVVSLLLNNTDRHIYTIERDADAKSQMLYRYTISGQQLVKESLSRVVSLQQAVDMVQVRESNVTINVVSSDKSRLVRVKNEDALLFSTQQAYQTLAEQGISDVSVDSLVLPFVINLNKEKLYQHEGVNRMFYKKGKVWQLNTEHIAAFDETLKAAFSVVLDSVKTALREAALSRQIQIAA